MAKAGVVDVLKKASQGLLYRSDTDAPFVAFAWPGESGKPSKERVRELAGAAAGVPVTTRTVDAFFRDQVEQDWMDDAERDEARRVEQLVEVLRQNLDGVKVFVIGRPKAGAEAYIVGQAEGWAGLKTQIAET